VSQKIHRPALLVLSKQWSVISYQKVEAKMRDRSLGLGRASGRLISTGN
jgi:hypothetical protein